MADQKNAPKSALEVELDALEKQIPAAAKVFAGGIVNKIVSFIRKIVQQNAELERKVAALESKGQ